MSGYNVALDSIDVFPKTVYITKKIPTRLWGLGCLSVMGQDDPDCRHMSKWGCITGFGINTKVSRLACESRVFFVFNNIIFSFVVCR